MRQIAELLASQGFTVRALATTACEGDADQNHAACLSAGGWYPKRIRSFAKHQQHVLELDTSGVQHELIEVDPRRKHHWEQDVGQVHAAHLQRLQAEFRPTIVLTFGGDQADQKRRAALRSAGAHVVFALHNLHYLPHRPTACDTFLAPSHFLAQRYARAWGEEIAVLPPAMAAETVLATSHEPVFITWFNPEPAKGLWLMARIAERLGNERPDIPLLVVEGRGRATNLVAAGRAAGVDLCRYPNIMFNPPVTRVAELWAACRVLLMPSVVEEAAGRVAMEAMLNGAVPIVSDRGGLPELIGDAGIIVPLPANYTRNCRAPLPREMAAPWFDAITRLVDDEAEFYKRSAAARTAAAAWLPDQLGPAYARWFSLAVS